MKNNSCKVLIIATSRKTRGGITSVIKEHETGNQWVKYNCKWLETHRDKGYIVKFFYFLSSFIQYLFILPFYNIVHIHTSEPASAIRKLIYFLYARLWKRKIIIHFHAFSIETTLNGKYKFIYEFLFNYSDLVIVLSDFWKKQIVENFGIKTKVVVLFNPSTLPNNTINYTKKKHILYAGTLNARKGYVDLIKAFAKISNKYNEWKLVIAGNGEVEQAKQLTIELGVFEKVIFTGWIDGELKSKVFQQASIFCLPSYAEGFPMAVLDAWAYGIPVITTPVGGLPDVLIHNENALIFDAGNINLLASSIETLIKDELLRNKISKESLLLSSNKFMPNVINSKLDEIYFNINFSRTK